MCSVSHDDGSEKDHEPPWRDLSLNRPGQAARKQAVARRQASPVKTFIAAILGVRTQAGAWRVGADGEVEVARRLAKLGEGWHTIHAVPVGGRGSDIDHVVIGPAGVFSLNTKNHGHGTVWVKRNAFLVNGKQKAYLEPSRYEADRASRLLTAACGFDVVVEPIIVVMAASLIVKSQPPGVHVVGRKQIRKWLTKRRAVLTPERVAEIYAYARRDTTWQPRTIRSGDV
jgi:hypothetical protein